ncbi:MULTISPECIES: hypothetical protein [Phaeobacter]|uniref:hypothetical protein n=1 Tax=Phaeobacter TaxID=302485 RepID=UPI000590B8A3|nr:MULTISPECIES: hypothetical protein [Phaeobacter]AUQ89381.1 hypothetical protein PhaeoP24_00735 [Phaeobacter inhibens]KII12600.1 hypothetical protein OO25_17090 [Phaeobacter sp. S60]
MTLAAPRFANAPAAHFDLEPFHVIAHAELADFPLAAPGVCLNPMCSRQFTPSRSWQRYCCDTCRKMDEVEMRRVGQKAAPALLAWRMGKYEEQDAALRALSRAGRNYISRLQSEWYCDRQRRAFGKGA